MYSEVAWYPSIKETALSLRGVMGQTRLSAGFGISIPINPMISILLYYNALNFNSQGGRGDIERKGYINLNIGFF
jgi:hypothetical protein